MKVLPSLKSLLWILTFSLATFTAEGEETLYLVTGDYAPFSGQTLPQGGMTTEITTQAFREMGYEAHIDFEPWKRGYINTGKLLYFGTFPYVKDSNREKDFLFSHPLYTIKVNFFVRSDFNKTFSKKQDLKGLKTCLPVGYSSREIQDLIDEEIISITMRPSNDAACFRALEKNRVDLYAINFITGWQIIKNTFGRIDGFKNIGEPLMPAHYHLIVSKQHPKGQALLNVFNEGLTRLKHNGLYQDILERHLAQ